MAHGGTAASRNGQWVPATGRPNVHAHGVGENITANEQDMACISMFSRVHEPRALGT
jgi:hypothetical protein